MRSEFTNEENSRGKLHERCEKKTRTHKYRKERTNEIGMVINST